VIIRLFVRGEYGTNCAPFGEEESSVESILDHLTSENDSGMQHTCVDSISLDHSSLIADTLHERLSDYRVTGYVSTT
jgi:hypothetical protein